MKKYDTLVIGHPSFDFNIDWQDNLITELGGAVFYSSASAYAGGNKVGVVTKLAEKDKDALKKFVIPQEDIFYIPSSKSTSIRNKYFTADKERRKCTCISQADPFTIDDIPDVESDIYHFAGLIYGDYADGLIEELSKRGKVAVDVQGFLRHASGDNTDMYFENWADRERLIPYVTYLKTDAAEAEILTGKTDRKEAARILYDMGAKEVLITHNTEVLAYDGKRMYTCPIKARSLVGRSGRGDTTFAAYITERKRASVEEALLFATACVSSKMEKLGPYTGKREDILAYIREFY